ncbi:Unknown protein sequence [Pseudomonas amygdali pv. lachrymans]|nr:Unknown protein sequence [Pseudomonas amygdali pv. lachrymans]
MLSGASGLRLGRLEGDSFELEIAIFVVAFGDLMADIL